MGNDFGFFWVMTEPVFMARVTNLQREKRSKHFGLTQEKVFQARDIYMLVPSLTYWWDYSWYLSRSLWMSPLNRVALEHVQERKCTDCWSNSSDRVEPKVLTDLWQPAGASKMSNNQMGQYGSRLSVCIFRYLLRKRHDVGFVFIFFLGFFFFCKSKVVQVWYLAS